MKRTIYYSSKKKRTVNTAFYRIYDLLQVIPIATASDTTGTYIYKLSHNDKTNTLLLTARCSRPAQSWADQTFCVPRAPGNAPECKHFFFCASVSSFKALKISRCVSSIRSATDASSTRLLFSGRRWLLVLSTVLLLSPSSCSSTYGWSGSPVSIPPFILSIASSPMIWIIFSYIISRIIIILS